MTLVLSSLSNGLNEPPRFDLVAPIADLLGFEIWEVDSKGNILSSSDKSLLPVDWEQIELPPEGSETAVTNVSVFRPLMALITVRKAGLTPRYLVYFFHQAKRAHENITYFYLYSLWLMLVAAIGVYFLFKARVKSNET